MIGGKELMPREEELKRRGEELMPVLVRAACKTKVSREADSVRTTNMWTLGLVIVAQGKRRLPSAITLLAE